MIGIVDIATYLPRRRVPAAVLRQAGHPADCDAIRVAGPDEDAVTLALAAVAALVEAPESAGHEIGWAGSKTDIETDVLLLASTSLPYTRRVQAGALATTLGICGPGVFTSTLTTSARAGTEALTLAAVLADGGRRSLVVAAETATRARRGLGAGAAAVLLGAEGGRAEIIGHGHAVFEDPGLDSVPADEGAARDINVPGYTNDAVYRAMSAAAGAAAEVTGLRAGKHTHLVAAGAPPAVLAKVLRRMDARADGGVFAETGDTGAAAALLGLASVLDRAGPGDTVLLLAFGAGSAADAVSLRVAAPAPAGRGGCPPADLDFAEYLRLTGVI